VAFGKEFNREAFVFMPGFPVSLHTPSANHESTGKG
jgi:hypothetical protein